MKSLKVVLIMFFIVVLSGCTAIRNNLLYGEEIKAFNAQMSKVTEQLEIEKNYVIETETVTKLYYINSAFPMSTVTVYGNQTYDEEALYFCEYQHAYGYPTLDYRIVDGSDNRLIDYNVSSDFLSYDVISNDADTEDFKDYLKEYIETSETILTKFRDFEQLSDYEFDVTLKLVNLDIYEDLSAELEEYDVTGLEDLEVVLSFVFLEDDFGYDLSFELNDLQVEINQQQYKFNIVTTSEFRITEGTQIELENRNFKMVLPDKKENIVFDTQIYFSQEFFLGEKGEGWVRLNLEPNTYQITIYNAESVSTKIYNSENIEISATNIFTVTTAGTYYVYIDCEYAAMISFRVRTT